MSLFGSVALNNRSNEKVAALATQLTQAAGSGGVEEERKEFDFPQPLPTGLMGLVINRCAGRCGANPTEAWRRDLITIAPAARTVPRVLDEAALSMLQAMSLHDLREHAMQQGVTVASLDQAEGDLSATGAMFQATIIDLIAMAPVDVELSIAQRSPSVVVIVARCLRDSGSGGHHALCVRQLAIFAHELEAVLSEKWQGCVPAVRAPEEPEPEPGPEPGPAPEEGVPPV